MRYWNDGFIHGPNLAIIPGVFTNEQCMDLCLQNTDCVIFVLLRISALCVLRPDDGSTTSLTPRGGYSAGVRCDRSLPANPADGAYPAAGKTSFILHRTKKGPFTKWGTSISHSELSRWKPFLFSLNGNILLNAIKIGNFSFQFFEFCKFNLSAPPFYIFCNSGRMKTKFLIMSRIFSYNDVTSRHGRSSKFFTLKRKS